jgi:Domain of unknown function (DUF4281)
MMSLDLLFSASGALAMAGWLSVAFVPRRYPVPRWIATFIALAIATLYAALIGAFWSQGEGGFGSLNDVARLFEHRGLLLAGWIHYLAFDLLIGLWEREEAARIGLPWWALLPCLALTFLFGPLGWLLFMGMRLFRLRTATTHSSPTHP